MFELEIPKSSGIYQIHNCINGKNYIGQAVNLLNRKKRHWTSSKHPKSIERHLCRAMRLYGEQNFIFKILEICSKEELNEKENFWVVELKSWDPEFGYNKTFGGDHSNPTPETRKKMSESHKGKVLSKEHTEAISKSNTGKKRTEEQCKRISESLKGKLKGVPLSEKHKKNIGRGLKGKTKGKKLTEKTKTKIKEARAKQAPMTASGREKIRILHTGRKRPPETGKKISEAQLGEKHYSYIKLTCNQRKIVFILLSYNYSKQIIADVISELIEKKITRNVIIRVQKEEEKELKRVS